MGFKWTYDMVVKMINRSSEKKKSKKEEEQKEHEKST
jgi:hypothetical protein